MRDNADLMDDILDQQEREYARETLIWQMTDEMWEDVTTKTTRRMDEKGWYFSVEVILNIGTIVRPIELCIGSYISDDRDEATDMAEREADVYFEKIARAKLGVR